MVILDTNTSLNSDEKTEDESDYDSGSKKISIKTSITYEMAKNGDRLFCVLAVADSDLSTLVTTHKEELPLRPIGKKHFT